MVFRSKAQRRWLKKHKPAVAKKIAGRSGDRVKGNSRKRKRRG